jgi:hypothetical protein
MTRTETTRGQLRDLYNARPFQAFVLSLENGDQILVEHPENLAFDPTDQGSGDLMVLTTKLRRWTSLAAVTTLAKLADAELPA